MYQQRGLKIGLVYELGQPVHRIGGTIGLHINVGAFQITSNHTIFYAFKNYGPQIPRLESQSDLNLGVAFGEQKTNFENLALLSPISNYSLRNYMISYGVKLYSDKIRTDQLTGLMSVRLADYFIAAENDGFVFLPYDKFRTGAITVGRHFYHQGNFNDLLYEQKLSLDIILYTGQTQNAPTERVNESNYPSRFGYKKLNDSKYSKASHGILKLSWQTATYFNQSAFASIGIDNEHIRNAVQNKFIHDLPFLPKRIIKIENPHIPMRNSEGADYLYRGNEKIRKGKFVWGVGLNRVLFY